VVVEVEVLSNPEENNGWTVLATTVPPAAGTDTEILQAYHDQNTTVEPGFRWIKNPAAIAPVWLEKPERIAALAMLTVIGLLDGHFISSPPVEQQSDDTVWVDRKCVQSVGGGG
jgi:hypothetical protein